MLLHHIECIDGSAEGAMEPATRERFDTIAVNPWFFGILSAGAARYSQHWGATPLL